MTQSVSFIYRKRRESKKLSFYFFLQPTLYIFDSSWLYFRAFSKMRFKSLTHSPKDWYCPACNTILRYKEDGEVEHLIVRAMVFDPKGAHTLLLIWYPCDAVHLYQCDAVYFPQLTLLWNGYLFRVLGKVRQNTTLKKQVTLGNLGGGEL